MIREVLRRDVRPWGRPGPVRTVAVGADHGSAL